MTPEAAIAACARQIARCRDASGACAYTPGASPRAEPTALALLASVRLRSTQGAPSPDMEGLPALDDPALLRWLRDQPPQWGLALLPALPLPDDLRANTLRWLLSARSLPVEGMDGFDATLPGWSWVDGTAAWVEPTARALIALCRCPPLAGIDDGARRQAVGEGARLLIDRQCQDGGWNYGNPRVLGQELASDAHSTGWAVLGLCAARDHLSADPAASSPATPALIDLSLAIALADPALSHAASRPGLASLALSALARRAAGGDPVPLATALLRYIDPEEGAGGRADWSALCALALSGLSL